MCRHAAGVKLTRGPHMLQFLAQLPVPMSSIQAADVSAASAVAAVRQAMERQQRGLRTASGGAVARPSSHASLSDAQLDLLAAPRGVPKDFPSEEATPARAAAVRSPPKPPRPSPRAPAPPQPLNSRPTRADRSAAMAMRSASHGTTLPYLLHCPPRLPGPLSAPAKEHVWLCGHKHSGQCSQFPPSSSHTRTALWQL